MKKYFTKLGIGLIIVLFIGAFSFTSCNNKKNAPAIPPENSFVLQSFDGDTTSKVAPGIWHQNWGLAASNVFVWTTITTVVMAVPVAAYKTALSQEAHHVSGDKWVWEYSVGLGFKVYTARLYGETFEDKVVWEMYISLQNDFKDFLWFSGTQNIEGTAGQWIIYESPTKNNELLQIDWTKNVDDETGTLKYTNIKPEGAENGGYIYYGNDQEGEYNAFFDIYNKGQDNLIEIDINTTHNNGRIKHFNYYLDNLWHCWNSSLIDEVCDVPTK